MSIDLQKARILVAVAHNDDVEFICGGILSKLHRERRCGDLRLLTFASREKNTGERFEDVLRQQSNAFEKLGLKENFTYENLDLRARFLPNHADEIRLKLKKINEDWSPNIVITHFQQDRNQDHQCVVEQVKRVFMSSTIIGGEISNTGFSMVPNLFMQIDQEDVERKHAALQCYSSESSKYYFSFDLLNSLAIVRGAQSVKYKYAEAFEVIRLFG